MSLSKIKLNAIGPRLVIWTTLLLAISLLVVSTIVYYLLSNSLRESDQNYILKIAQNYAHIIKHKGLESIDPDSVPQALLVMVADKDHNISFAALPDYIDHDFEDEDEIRQLDEAARVLPLRQGWETVLLLSGEENDNFYERAEFALWKFVWRNRWFKILPIIDNDLIEVYTMPLEHGQWLKIGKSSEEREEHLSQIRKITLMVLIPFIFFGLLLSFFLARSILAPMKNLVHTIDRIKNGDPKVRALVKGSGDEVDVLAEEINTLLDHNDQLISNLKNTIDNVAHDLRTPLTRFRASLEYAVSHNQDPAVLQEALQEGLENSDRILQLLNAIMDVSEAESHTMRIKREPIKVTQFFEQLQDLFQYVAEDKGIQLILSTDDDFQILGDHVRLAQAFGNLIDNALKYSNAGTTIKIHASAQSKDKLLITIKDQGQGISSEDLDKIWDRLYRADKSRSTSGLGLGLSVVKAIVTAHQGSVAVQSESGVGSTFTVTLPLCNSEVSLS